MSTKKRGLGRGLEALLGNASYVAAGTEKLQTLPVETLKAGAFQPRKDFDPARLQELADSISAQGVVQPIVVRSAGPASYEIVAGERRWRAAQLAGLQDVPVIIREVSDQAAIAIALIENIQRQDLNPLEEAEALQRLSSEFTMTHQQIADAVGKSRTTITNLLRLNELHPEVKRLLVDGGLEMGHARAILGLPQDRQASVARRVAAKNLNVRATESLIRKLQAVTKPRPGGGDPDITRLADRIAETLGAKVQIRHSAKGAGQLIINYANLDHLQGVLDRLAI